MHWDLDDMAACSVAFPVDLQASAFPVVLVAFVEGSASAERHVQIAEAVGGLNAAVVVAQDRPSSESGC